MALVEPDENDYDCYSNLLGSSHVFAGLFHRRQHPSLEGSSHNDNALELSTPGPTMPTLGQPWDLQLKNGTHAIHSMHADGSISAEFIAYE